MNIIQTNLNLSEVVNLLLLGDEDFSPSLSSCLDVRAYAEKLSSNAYFIILEDVDEIKGCVAYYKNLEGNFIYISHFWVSSLCQRKHYGSMMLETLINSNRNEYHEIRLEVVKLNPAYFFYASHGFQIEEDRGNKYLLSLVI